MAIIALAAALFTAGGCMSPIGPLGSRLLPLGKQADEAEHLQPVPNDTFPTAGEVGLGYAEE